MVWWGGGGQGKSHFRPEWWANSAEMWIFWELFSPPRGTWSAYSRAGSDLSARPVGFKPDIQLPEPGFPLPYNGDLSIE